MRHALPVPHCGGHDLRHHRAALDPRHPGRIGAGRRDSRHQVADCLKQHARLAQRRQYLADVAQEGGVRTDQEHASLLELAPVGVEQVGRPVQGHRGLAGARTALHDEHARQSRPDDPVLFGLDGLDDVPHPAGTAEVQRREQRRFAGQTLVPAGVCGREVEHLVIEPQHGPGPGLDVAPHPDVARGGRRGQVERPGGVGAPVHQQLVVVLVVGMHVRGIELRDLLPVHDRERLTLGPCRGRPADLPQRPGQPVRCALPELVQPAVQAGDVGVLAVPFEVSTVLARQARVPSPLKSARTV